MEAAARSCPTPRIRWDFGDRDRARTLLFVGAEGGMSKRIDRRLAVKAFVLGLGAIPLGRVLAACSGGTDSLNKPGGGAPTPPGDTTPPNDQNETVPGTSTPVETGPNPPQVPNQSWEARAKQLEDEQAAEYGAVFTAIAPGVFAGKETSHVPDVSTLPDSNGFKQVQVVVHHVMGANGLDAGMVDSGSTADAGGNKDAGGGKTGDAGKADGGDAGAEDAGDAGAMPVHYITTIYLRATVNGQNLVVGLWEFEDTDAAPPTVNFTLPAGVTQLTAYEHCTLHGLWATALVPA
jgi:Desulfoferrodoxin